MSPQQQSYSMPFWDFIRSLDPNQGPGRGVDHTTAPPPFPPYGAGFPFGGPDQHGALPHHPPPPPGPHGAQPPPPPPYGPGYGPGFEWGPWYHDAMGHGGPWDRRGRGHHGHGRRHQRGAINEGEPGFEDDWISASDAERDLAVDDDEKRGSPDTMPVDAPDPEEVAPNDDDAPPRHHPQFGGRGGRGGRGRGGRCGRGGRGGRGGLFGRDGFGPHRGPGGRGGRFSHGHGPPPYPGQGFFPFDFGGFMRGCANHPLFRNIRDHAQRFQDANGANDDGDDTFTPPVDIFDTERAFVLHVSLPGAKKDDIGINWDADRSLLNIAGVVHRPGDEEFLAAMASSERKVGMFERNVTLPPEDSDRPDEIDGSAITAKMEDGILVITVPKIEKEWTEVRKVDIE